MIVKLTTTQAKTLLNAFPETSPTTGRRTGAVQLCGDVRKSTRGALIRMGMVVPSGLYLTVRGQRAVVAVQEAVSTQNVYTQGCKIELAPADDDTDTYSSVTVIAPVPADAFRGDVIVPDAQAETSTMIAETLGSVVVEGVDPSEFAPDFLASGAAECYFTSSTCVGPVVAVFVDCVGRTEGVCVAHRDRVEGTTYELPNATICKPQTLAHARQKMGKDITTGEPLPVADDSHVIIPGVHALDLGDGAYNRFVGIGESSSVPGSMFTYGLATAISLAPGMNGTGKLNVPTEFGDVITVRTSLGDVRYVVQRERHADPSLIEYTLESARCFVCLAKGDNSLPGSNVDGEWLCGFCHADGITPGNLRSHVLSFYCETEGAGRKFDCDGCGSIGTRSYFGKFTCGADDVSPVPHVFNLCNVSECPECATLMFNACQEAHGGDSDCAACAAYVSALPVVPEPCEGAYAAIASLTTGAGFGTVEDDQEDAGFVESMVTMDYRLSVIVDERTGATVDLGWVTLDMNAAQAHDDARIADAYGAAHGTGMPRHGWESIIIVHQVCAV